MILEAQYHVDIRGPEQCPLNTNLKRQVINLSKEIFFKFQNSKYNIDKVPLTLDAPTNKPIEFKGVKPETLKKGWMDAVE